MEKPTDPAEKTPPRRTGTPVALIALALALVAVGVVVYERSGAGRKEAAECSGAKAIAAKLDPLAHGEVAAFSVAKSPLPVPSFAFDAPEGGRKTLADFRGRTVLLNLWATWCVPCRQEMPALDKLQAALGGPSFQVVAVNIDTSRLERPKQFLDEVGAKSLGLYADPSADAFETLRQAGKVTGLPTSLLIDPRGCEIGTLAGGAEWDSTEALALVKAAIGS